MDESTPCIQFVYETESPTRDKMIEIECAIEDMMKKQPPGRSNAIVTFVIVGASVGANGIGKSTMLREVLGQLRLGATRPVLIQNALLPASCTSSSSSSSSTRGNEMWKLEKLAQKQQNREQARGRNKWK
jgi:hypothetical protein